MLIIDESSKIPGPGSYPMLPSISKDGKYYLSKFKNSKASAFNPPSSKRFAGGYGNYKVYSGTFVPGPGQYSPKVEMNKDGKYFISKLHSSGARTFSTGNRITIDTRKTKDVPGPGNYEPFSEFGWPKSSLPQSNQNKENEAK